MTPWFLIWVALGLRVASLPRRSYPCLDIIQETEFIITVVQPHLDLLMLQKSAKRRKGTWFAKAVERDTSTWSCGDTWAYEMSSEFGELKLPIPVGPLVGETRVGVPN
ncbi:hypothetical protein N657DRAFT_668973 [Parathielavia appendiculata]|uniref:Secreted protein n=1 Tax=Parathielavia appendiculata TaxID=2587402 RepID=A0AAN6Z6M4_9PEZI|nr:hypothetical protein N657DRAFT_668973 [Parathielavia appendiculata]